MKVAIQTVLVIILSCLSCFATSETMYQALSRDPQLTEFYKMINKDEVLQLLLDKRVVTIFAPTNEAIQRARKRRPLTDEIKLPSFHVLNLLAKKSIFPASVAPYRAGVAPLFLSIKDTDPRERKQFFVNNAKIIRESEHRGTEGGDQLLYVVDDIVEPYKPETTIPPSALDLLKQPSIYGLKEPLDAFSSRVTEDREKDIFQRVGNHTYFLPIGSVDNENFNKLQDIDNWVVRGHIIEKHVLFTRTMSRKAYKSMTYNDHLKIELTLTTDDFDDDDDFYHHDDDGEEYYIQSNTIQGDHGHRKGVVRAKIVKPNIPVSNGVVHLISHPLMIIDKTIWNFIEKERDNHLGQFYELVSRDPEFLAHLKSSSQRTVFAPTDKAFRVLDKTKFDNVLSNATAAHNLLALHMVMTSVATEDVWNKNVTTLLASDNRRSLYFRVIGEERNKTLTVEGGGVNATAIMGDIGATNGMLHVIDRVLGMPYLTVYNKLKHDPDLHTTFKLSQQEDWNLKLNDKEKSYTFFVPDRKAWENLRMEMPSEHKQLHLGQFSYHVHKILDRHLVVGSALTKEDLEKQDKIQMVHGMFKISPGYQDSKLVVEWEGLQANIVRADVKATNGIIHVIDRVMMKRRDLTKSGSSPTGSSSFMIIVIFSTIFSLETILNRKL